MTNWTDLTDDLTAYLHGELDPARAAEIEAAAASDAGFAAELEALRETLTSVRSALDIEPRSDDTARLLAALDAELLRHPVDATSRPEPDEAPAPVLRPRFGERVASMYAYAQYRYRASAGFRRFVSASLVAHAAAVLVVGWVILDDAVLSRRPVVGWSPETARSPWDAATAPDDSLLDVPSPEVDAGVIEQPEPLRAFEPADDRGLAPEPPVEPFGGTGVDTTERRYPTLAVMLRYRAVFDDGDRAQQVREHAGKFAAQVEAGIEGGLDFLSSRRRPDGTWTPSDDATPEVRTGTTAAVVLAMSQGGRSAVRGPHATLLAPAVRHLEAFVAEGHADRAVQQPLYPLSLALRALSVQYALDFPHLSTAERTARRSLLAAGARTLLSWQQGDGGYGYGPKSERSDSSCTLFASAALADLRTVGVLDTRPALDDAGRYLAGNLRDNGILDYRLARDRDGDLSLTAGLMSLNRELGVSRRKLSLVRVKQALRELDGSDALLLTAGTAALRRHGISIETPLGHLVETQRKDGSWSAATDRHLRQGGDDIVTAYGVLALTSAYVR